MSSPYLVVIGTRPEAIKLAPIVRLLGDEAIVVSTGQHREMLIPLMERLGISPDADLQTMRPGQSLSSLTAALMVGLASVIQRVEPRSVIVQGDTTSAMTAALCAFYQKIDVAHVEAGLRSGVRDNPFPEEVNRRIISQIARWNFAPTLRAGDNLRRSGVDGEIEVTGNTVVDNLHWVMSEGLGRSHFVSAKKRILVTLHRRENQGAVMEDLAAALIGIAGRGDVEILLPLHKSPTVRQSLSSLHGRSGIRLIEPMDYFDFVSTMASSSIVLTDSGGVQEEAPTFGKPVLVLRETTERPEAVDAGMARLVGVDCNVVVKHTTELLDDALAYEAMAGGSNPYGDGRAAERIVGHLLGS